MTRRTKGIVLWCFIVVCGVYLGSGLAVVHLYKFLKILVDAGLLVW